MKRSRPAIKGATGRQRRVGTWASGREVLLIGGFTGTVPEPTLATLQNLIRTGFVATFLQSPTTIDPRLTWIARHRMNVTPPVGGLGPPSSGGLLLVSAHVVPLAGHVDDKALALQDRQGPGGGPMRRPRERR
jgi:hypothetical protein